MTLNALEPTDQRMVSELAAYIREARSAINSISSLTGAIGITTLEVAAGSISLSVGTDLASYGLEIVIISGTGLSDIETILGGSDGQIKIFVFQDTNIDLVDGNVKTGGAFFLNHLPAASEFNAQIDDVIALVNVGGDGGSTYGYWKELFRTLSVK